MFEKMENQFKLLFDEDFRKLSVNAVNCWCNF